MTALGHAVLTFVREDLLKGRDVPVDADTYLFDQGIVDSLGILGSSRSSSCRSVGRLTTARSSWSISVRSGPSRGASVDRRGGAQSWRPTASTRCFGAARSSHARRSASSSPVRRGISSLARCPLRTAGARSGGHAGDRFAGHRSRDAGSRWIPRLFWRFAVQPTMPTPFSRPRRATTSTPGWPVSLCRVRMWRRS